MIVVRISGASEIYLKSNEVGHYNHSNSHTLNTFLSIIYLHITIGE